MKIKITDSFESAVCKITEGNPGAVTCIISMLESFPERGMAAMFLCDKHGLYGSALYELWNDVCERDSEMLIGIIEGLDEIPELGLNEQTPDNVEDVLKEIERIATKMAILAKMSTDDTEELMADLKNEELTETELLEVLDNLKMFLKLGEELTKSK